MLAGFGGASSGSDLSGVVCIVIIVAPTQFTPVGLGRALHFQFQVSGRSLPHLSIYYLGSIAFRAL